jgi:iron complex outermembrane recepter protein
LNFTYGSYNFVRPTIDISGPLTPDKAVRYRLNAAYERADSFRDFVETESFFVSPVIEWQIGDRTKLTLEYEHQSYNLNFDQGFPLEPEVLKLPRNRFLGEPGFSNGNLSFNSVSYVLEHNFSDTVKFRQGFNYLSSVLSNARQSFSAGLQDDRRTFDRFLSASDEEHSNLTFQNQLSIKFDTGSVKHTLLVGVDYARNLFNYLFAPDLELPIDIFNPQYGGIPTPVEDGEPFGRKIVSNTVGIFAQDFVELLPNLKLLLGGRLDFNRYKREDRVTDEILNEQAVTRFSPRVGIVYQPTNATSLFFNWGNSFSPQFQARSRTNTLFDPQTTQQYEFGIKQDLVKDRLGVTLAFFEVKKQNVLTPDPEDTRFSIQTGEQRSRGIELDITGEILPGWNVIATYAYLDATVTKDNRIPVGDRIFGVPQNSASLWTTYRFLKGNLQGLGFGLGITYLGEQEVSLPNSFTVPAYAKLDAALFYERERYKVALNFKNITGAKYYQLDSYNIDPNAPFTVFATVSVKF